MKLAILGLIIAGQVLAAPLVHIVHPSGFRVAGQRFLSLVLFVLAGTDPSGAERHHFSSVAQQLIWTSLGADTSLSWNFRNIPKRHRFIPKGSIVL